MIITFIEKLGGLFDRRFWTAYWMPVFIGFLLLASIIAIHYGMVAMLRRWLEMNATEQTVLAFSALLTITMFAYLLQALTSPLMRFYEGYALPRRLAEWSKAGQENQVNRLIAGMNDPANKSSASDARNRYTYFPENLKRLRPTRFGNTLTAAEEHAYNMLKLDSVLWWPRLFPLLPENFREQVNTALVPVVGLLNLCTALILLATFGSGFIFWTDQRWWLFGLILPGGLVLARFCYIAAIHAAVSYGNLIRTAFDLYRHNILKQMGIFVPTNVDDEVYLWRALNIWIAHEHWFPYYLHVKEKGSAPAWLEQPFYYNGLGPPKSEIPKPQKIEMTIEGKFS